MSITFSVAQGQRNCPFSPIQLLMVVNTTTAEALGLAVRPSILLLADEVIE